MKDISSIVYSPRTLLRKAVVRILQDDKGPLFPLVGGRVFPNHEEHWEEEILPACGVYALTETGVESDVSPDPQKRELTLRIELLARHNKNFDSLDDLLDALSFGVERVLAFETLCGAVAEIMREKRQESAEAGVIVDCDMGDADFIHDLTCDGVSLGFAEDGQRTVGIAILDYTIEYAAGDFLDASRLPDFLQGGTGWDVAGSDPRVMDAEDMVEFDPAGNETVGAGKDFQ